MLNHVGITISDENEIKNFYQDLLGLKLEKQFTISKEQNNKIFGFYESVPIYLLTNGDVKFEIFVTSLPARKNYTHLCIEVEDRKKILEKAKKMHYKCIVIPRNNSDQIFLKDRFGNLFEIKKKK